MVWVVVKVKMIVVEIKFIWYFICYPDTNVGDFALI